MEELHWDELVLERRTAPVPLSDDQFREWMAGRPIFVSSVMDGEMAPARDAVRRWIRSWGGEPVMWEEITPQDRRPEEAYLDGVDRSEIAVLMLGTAYGVSDATGFSPTHKEGNRAAERGITRLLFQPEGIPSSDRDGRLNNWVRSLYSEVSGGSYSDVTELTDKLEARLREIAASQQTPWIKLGQLVFPGGLVRRNRGGEAEFEVRATVRNLEVRRAMEQIGSWSGHVATDQLTWSTHTQAVRSLEAETHTGSPSQIAVNLSGRLSDPGNSMRSAMSEVTMNLRDGRRLTPSDQAALWVRYSVFGEDVPELPDPTDRGSVGFETLRLPEILQRYGARGWLAEGLVRLYVVEGLITRFGGGFVHLEIGPTTATSVRVSLTFRPAGFDPASVTIAGLVPLR